MRMDPDVGAQGGERVVWEYHSVSLNRVPGYGFGIAVSGGRDNPHFTTGDPSIAISDVLKAGPAEGKLHVNDRVLSANGVSLESVDYATAVQVLKDSGQLVQLYIKRRVVLPAIGEPQTIRLTLTKTRRKDDFGVVLGCQLYVKEITGRPAIAERDVTLQEGDVVLRLNHLPADGMPLKEARRILEAAKERLSLTVRRQPSAAALQGKESPSHHQTRSPSDGRPSYGASQNLYVQPPTRSDRDHRAAGHPDSKNNLVRQNGRSRGPLMDISLSQLDQPATPLLHGQREPTPPRPPPPRDAVDAPLPNGVSGSHHPQNSDFYESRRQASYDQHSPQSKGPAPDPRFVSFQKEGSVGIRLTGGNKTGIYVTAVQASSPAAVQGLQPGDKIIKVNGMEMKGVTREEAVLFLLSLQDQIDLIVQYKKNDYDQLVASQQGDSFYIRTHFNYEQANKSELSFRKGDIFHVVDTLNMGVVGAWQVYRIGRNNEATQKGVIPNKSRAEELATAQFNAAKKEQTFSEARSRLFSRRRRQRRSKSLGKDHWEDLVFADSVSKFPAYERVVLRAAGFVRPVVLFGALADVAREQLLSDLPDRLASPQLVPGAESKSNGSGIIRLSAIRELVERGRHALLDVTPNAVDRLNYAQLYPICVFLRAESKHAIKEARGTRAADQSHHKSSKKIYEQCMKLEKLWSHLFTVTVTIADADSWYRKVKELIDKQQNAPIWMSETKPIEMCSDIFLLPTSEDPFLQPHFQPGPSPPPAPLGRPPAPELPPPVPPPPLPPQPLSYYDTLAEELDSTLRPLPVYRARPLPPPLSPPPLHDMAPPLHDRTFDSESVYIYLPGESFSDDFLFPMTARLSYASSPESDPEGAEASPGRAPLVSPAASDPHLLRSASDPSLGAEELPPPLAALPGPPPYSPHQEDAPRPVGQRHSHGGDSRYGFSSARYAAEEAHQSPLHHSPPAALQDRHHRSSLQDHPPPHRTAIQERPPHHRTSLQDHPQPHRTSLPEAPPKVDRSSKPVSAVVGTRSYGRASGGQMRNYLDRDDVNYMNAGKNYTLDRLKSSHYDSTSSYESYNRLNNMHDDLKARSMPLEPRETGSPPGYGPRPHDPYRFTRSTAQPLRSPDREPGPRGLSGRNDYKLMPPPKSGPTYKPIPPPKPKGGRGAPPPTGEAHRRPAGAPDSPLRKTPDSRGSREDFAGYLTNGDDGGGFDSGHGSSLDRNCDLAGRTYMNMNVKPAGAPGYYLNAPPPGSAREPPQPGGLDLSTRDQRGSAFELYRKPADSRYPAFPDGAR
ncbi:tight junction protein ZO-1-like [Pollicipes pollicipes]|uniref:tight junction protein ZO-1-like n=1 Tax=Pollicipes pollicipes TaxID=41117 RepID=UPI0018856E76|nr:tight junction protein ZO-1-like [Pollicipes pollicipes]